MPDTPDQYHPAPVPARGMSRWLNRAVHAAMHLLPSGARRALGWWSWRDLLDRRHEYGVLLDNGIKGEGPAHALWRRGIPLTPDIIPLPPEFNDLHKPWNWECLWDKVPPQEVAAWAAIWKAHPKGQVCLDHAVVGMAQAGRSARVRILLEHGANPSPPQTLRSYKPPSLMRQLLGTPYLPMHTVLEVLNEVCRVFPVSWQSWLDNEPCARKRTASEMEQWRASGLSMPSGEAALLHALKWVNDPPLSDPETSEAINAVRWWKTHGHLPTDAPTRILAEFLTSVRPGDEPYYQNAMNAWAAELLDQGLPPRPPVGPKWSKKSDARDDGPMPWSHWAAASIFPENLPSSLRDPLFSEPDCWTATNMDAKNAHGLHMDIIESECSEARAPGFIRLQAWLDSRQLEKQVDQVSHPSQVRAPVRRF